MAKSSKTRKAKLDHAGLTGLGMEKLVEILLDEVAYNKALKTRLLAALAGSGGADEVARLIDKRLDTLQKSQSYLSIAKANELAIELRGLLKNITSELAALDRYKAFIRMLRFAAVGASIEDRAYEGGARLHKVLQEADDSLVESVAKLDIDEQLRSVSLLETLRMGDAHGRYQNALQEILCDLQQPAADAWRTILLDKLRAPPAKTPDWRRNEPIAYLQRLASQNADIDTYVELETFKPEKQRDTLRVAKMLHEAKRHTEALEWVRRPSGVVRFMDLGGGLVGVALGAPSVQPGRQLEADILDALKQKTEAQAIRWVEFEQTLRPDILRIYISKLDDFAEFDETDRALALIAGSPRIYDALNFFIEWPRLDLAGKHVLKHLDAWDGKEYEVLAAAAAVLSDEQSAAATMLYRILLDNILRRAISTAYLSGAEYYAALHLLQSRLPADFPYQSHQDYVDAMKKTHGRKFAFWQLIHPDLL